MAKPRRSHELTLFSIAAIRRESDTRVWRLVARAGYAENPRPRSDLQRRLGC